MTIKKNFILITLFIFITYPVLVNAETINISVAASLTDAFKSLADTFKKDHPEITIQYNFGSSGSLAKQITQGAPADIYVSANTKWMDYLVAEQKIDTPSVRIFVHNSLVFVGKKNSSITSLKDLMTLNRIALGSPGSVPAGQYAAQALKATKRYDTLLSQNKLIMAKDVRQALLYADREEADGAFVYRTDALLAKNAVILFPVPPNLYDRIAYPLALTQTGKSKENARTIYDFLNGEKALAVLESFGFKGER